MHDPDSATPSSPPSGRDSRGAPFKVKPVQDRDNRADLVSYYFCLGKTASQIAKLLERDYECGEIYRELPYLDLNYATGANWLTYSPPKHLELANRLRQDHPSLLEVHIPSDGGRMAVVVEAAKLTARSIGHIARVLARKYAATWTFPLAPAELPVLRARDKYPGSEDPVLPPDPGGATHDPQPHPLVVEIRIGVSGGRSLGHGILQLGRILKEGVDGENLMGLEELERELKEEVGKVITRGEGAGPMPDPLVWRRFRVQVRLLFINLVSGYDTDPFNHPIASVTAMITSSDLLESRAEMKCFSATPFVELGSSREGGAWPNALLGVKEFVDRYGLDIILTSAGSLEDPHSMLRVFHGDGRADALDRDDTATGYLSRRHGVLGDFIWMPLRDRVPFRYETDLDDEGIRLLKHRPMTLLGLDDVAEHVRRGHDVVLMISPCGKCHEPKDPILRAVLGQESPLVTHLVADRISVARILGLGKG
jgi:hypothetical protein